MRADGRPALSTRGLVVDFGTVRALDGLSIEVPAGIVFGFLGPNGAGKTTVIRTLLGLVEPSAGSAEVLGLDPRRDAAAIRERCGALLEHPGLYERLSAADNLEFYGRIWRLRARERRDRARELLEQLALWDRRDEPVGRWSRGMKQKLAVARAMLHRPQLVFLDEPTSGLDPVATAALREDLAALAAREGVTIFLTTHNLAEAERLCTTVAVIRGGRLLAIGTPASLRAGTGAHLVRIAARGVGAELRARLAALPEVESVADDPDGALRVSLGSAPGEEPSAARIVALLVDGGAAVEEVVRIRPTLEQAFLDLVRGGEGNA